MWQVHNRTPFAADRSWVRDRAGAEVWLVAVRCTFEIRPDGSTALAEEQQPVMLAPKHFGEPAASSLKYDSDFVLTKPTTDVILHGSAHAPGHRPTTSVDVSLRVGEVRKTLRVTGERAYRRSPLGGDPTPDPAMPFVSLPIIAGRSRVADVAAVPRRGKFAAGHAGLAKEDPCGQTGKISRRRRCRRGGRGAGTLKPISRSCPEEAQQEECHDRVA